MAYNDDEVERLTKCTQDILAETYIPRLDELKKLLTIGMNKQREQETKLEKYEQIIRQIRQCHECHQLTIKKRHASTQTSNYSHKTKRKPLPGVAEEPEMELLTESNEKASTEPPPTPAPVSPPSSLNPVASCSYSPIINLPRPDAVVRVSNTTPTSQSTSILLKPKLPTTPSLIPDQNGTSTAMNVDTDSHSTLKPEMMPNRTPSKTYPNSEPEVIEIDSD